jgi:hypothetical protein
MGVTYNGDKSEEAGSHVHREVTKCQAATGL